MTAYPLFPLLRLRNLREDRAIHGLEVAKRRLVRARKNVQAARDAHKDFLTWLEQEEERRYQKVMETLMTLDDVDAFKQGLLGIRGREARYLDEILKAEHKVKGCEKDLVQAKADLLSAQKGTMKINVHRDRWEDAAKKEAERIEELEMEDFTGTGPEIFGLDDGDEQENWL